MGNFVAFLLCVLGTAVYHRFTISSGFDLVQADLNDSRFVLSILEHWWAVARGYAAWDSPLMFYPERGTIGYSDLLAGYALLYVPLRFFGVQPFVALNCVVVASTLLTFWATYLLARRALSLAAASAGVVAALFAFSWPRFAQSVHVQLQCSFFLPLLVLLLLAVFAAHRRGERGRVVILSLCIGLCGVLFVSTSYYLAFFSALAMGAVLLSALSVRGLREEVWRFCVQRWWIVLVATICTVALVTPLASVYLAVQRQSGGRLFVEALPYIPTLRDLLWMGGENFVWGALAAREPERAAANWAELRIGFGAVWSLLWVICVVVTVAGLCIAPLRRSLQRALFRFLSLDSTQVSWLSTGVVVVVALQVLALRYSPALSPWKVFFDHVPGAAAARSVARYVLVTSLLMALVIGVTGELLWRWALVLRTGWQRVVVHGAVCGLTLLMLLEQTGRIVHYSGSAAFNEAQAVASAIPEGCGAFFVMPKTQVFARTTVSREQFDEARYLAANPDVAAIWPGSAWEHFEQFGRNEMRFTDPEMANRHRRYLEGYAYSIPLVAAMLGKPAVNGISGLVPKGWELMDLYHPKLEQRLQVWLGESAGTVCIVRVDIEPMRLEGA